MSEAPVAGTFFKTVVTIVGLGLAAATPLAMPNEPAAGPVADDAAGQVFSGRIKRLKPLQFEFEPVMLAGNAGSLFRIPPGRRDAYRRELRPLSTPGVGIHARHS